MFFHRNDVIAKIRRASNSEAVGISILVVVLLVSPVIIFLVRNAANTIQVTPHTSYITLQLAPYHTIVDSILFSFILCTLADVCRQFIN